MEPLLLQRWKHSKNGLSWYIGITIFLVLPWLIVSENQAAEETVDIVVNASDYEPLSDIFRPSVVIEGRGWKWPVYKPGNPVLTKFQSEVGFSGTFRFFIWLDRTKFGPGGRVRFEDFLHWMKEIHRGGGRLIITLRGMPRWLSSCMFNCNDWNQEEKWAMSPPKDYAQYEELVYKIVKFYSVDNKLENIFYEVWSEPDHPGYWRGSEKEYLKLYKAVSKAIVRIKKKYGVDIKIGGPGTVSWNGYRGGDGLEADEKSLHKTIIYKFIAYCRKYDLPIDFVSFHRYDNDSKYHSIHNAGIFIRKWLNEFSFDPQTPLILTEWNLYVDHLERNNEKGASFIPSMLYDLDKAGIDYHTFFSVQDFDDIDPSPAGLGLFTLFGMAKPSYNVFVMLSKLGEYRLKTLISDDQNIGAIATRTKEGRIKVLIWNYPQLKPEKVFGRSLFHQTYSGPYLRSISQEERNEILLRIKGVLEKAPDSGRIADLHVPVGVKEDITRAIRHYYSTLAAREQSIKVKVLVKNLSPVSRFDCKRWLVDAEHSNGFKDNLQFLKEIKLQGLKEAALSLQKEGEKQEDFDVLLPLVTNSIKGYYEMDSKKVASSNSKLESLPAELKKTGKILVERLNEMLKQVSTDLPESLSDQAISMNSPPSVQLQLFEKKSISFNNPLELMITLKPYSVTLVILETE